MSDTRIKISTVIKTISQLAWLQSNIYINQLSTITRKQLVVYMECLATIVLSASKSSSSIDKKAVYELYYIINTLWAIYTHASATADSCMEHTASIDTEDKIGEYLTTHMVKAATAIGSLLIKKKDIYADILYITRDYLVISTQAIHRFIEGLDLPATSMFSEVRTQKLAPRPYMPTPRFISTTLEVATHLLKARLFYMVENKAFLSRMRKAIACLMACINETEVRASEADGTIYPAETDDREIRNSHLLQYFETTIPTVLWNQPLAHYTDVHYYRHLITKCYVLIWNIDI